MRYPRRPTKGPYRSKLEGRVADRLKELSIEADYETKKLDYILLKTYTPDFIIDDGRIMLEVKGVLDQQSRSKMAAVKEQHPEADIRFVFAKPHNRCPGLKSTHAEWAERHGYIWYDENEITKKDLK